LYSLENGNFLLDANFLALVIDNHTEYVSELEYENLLLNEYLADLEQNPFKEVVIVIEIASQQKFRLECCPNWVGLLATTLFTRE
jgi:hypothetical protein